MVSASSSDMISSTCGVTSCRGGAASLDEDSNSGYKVGLSLFVLFNPVGVPIAS